MYIFQYFYMCDYSHIVKIWTLVPGNKTTKPQGYVEGTIHKGWNFIDNPG